MGYVYVKPVAWKWKKGKIKNRKRKKQNPRKMGKEKFQESKIKS